MTRQKLNPFCIDQVMSYMIPRATILAMSIVVYECASHPSMLTGLRSIHLKCVLLYSKFMIFETNFNAI